jgi:hypothetical protein
MRDQNGATLSVLTNMPWPVASLLEASAQTNVERMFRILDIDLDFFVEPVVHMPQDDERPDPGDHTVWPAEQAFEFLTTKCGLSGPLPGILTERHDELFSRWRTLIETGILTPPFHVTHVDAHADLGLGDSGYVYLMTSLLAAPPADRWYPTPPPGSTGITEGNFLLFAIACRWINDLEYVYGEDGGEDELSCVMEGFDRAGDRVQLVAMTEMAFRNWNFGLSGCQPVISHYEPAVDYRSGRWEQFYIEQPYDLVCLTRSPRYTPSTADPLYEAIATAFIEPTEV